MPQVVNALKPTFMAGPLLCVGCRMQADRTLGVLKKVAIRHREVAHYAIVAKPISAAATPNPRTLHEQVGRRASDCLWKRLSPAPLGAPGKRLQGFTLSPGIPGFDSNCHQCLTPGQR